MPTTEQDSQEALSVAYAQAVAAQSGMNVGYKHKDYGLDLTFSYVSTMSDGSRVEIGYDLHFQLKSTINSALEDDCVVYDLSASAYNRLASCTGRSPCYLLVMRLPRDRERRLEISEEVMSLRECCYWYRIEPGEIIENTGSKRIRIPRKNKFTPEALNSLMHSLMNGGS